MIHLSGGTITRGSVTASQRFAGREFFRDHFPKVTTERPVFLAPGAAGPMPWSALAGFVASRSPFVEATCLQVGMRHRAQRFDQKG